MYLINISNIIGKTNISLHRQYWNINGWAMSQKLPVNNFEWIEDISQFIEDLIWNYNGCNEESDEIYFLKVEYIEKLPHNGLRFLPERMKIE